MQPPKWAQKTLLFFLREDLAEEVLGDLDEQFISDTKKYSTSKARRIYWLQVINYLRPFAIKYFKLNSTFSIMLKHNFLISFRHLLKNRTFSAINIGGLALGMSVAILIGLWIHDELGFNRYHKNYDRIVQVMRKDVESGITRVNSSLAGQLGVLLSENYPTLFETVNMTFFREQEALLTANLSAFDEIGYFFLPGASELFSFNIINGPPNGGINKSGIMISESLAEKLFGDRDPIGKIITMNTTTELAITAVYEDLPKNSVFANAGFMASMELYYNEQNPFVWDNYNIKVFALLREGVSIEHASSAIKDLMLPHRDPVFTPTELFLNPMKNWHLHSNFVNGVEVTGERLQYVRLYGIIGLFVLILAFINFINLNTAKYQNRSKEVGVRKSLGSHKSQLVHQFFAESILYSVFAMTVSILLVVLVLPWFNIVADKSIVMPAATVQFWLLIIAFTLTSGFVAGTYPALYLSSFNPIKALKGKVTQGRSSVNLRQGLVVFQFLISIILTIGTITVYLQVDHAKTRPVGYNQDSLLTFRMRSDAYYQNFNVLRNELIKTGWVTEVATANYPLMTTLGNNGGFRMAETDKIIDVTFNTIYVSPEYGKTTEWKLIEGRGFMREGVDESSSIIISRLAAEAMGVETAVGKQIIAPSWFNRTAPFTIVGVVEDMIKGSPFEEARPLMLFPSKRAMPYMFVRLKPGADFNAASLLMRDVFNELLPEDPFNYQFVDDEYLTKFKPEERISNLAAVFSIMAILISSLGIFGLSAYMVEKKTKEIGIRKVLGASVLNLWNMLSRDFGFLILIALVIAVPLAGYLLDSWLQSYEYRISIYWWIYGIAGAISLLVTLITVSYNSMKAAYINPIDSLRSE